MYYYYCQDCGWNTTHTSVFHAAWKHYPGTFAFPDGYEYWKMSGNTYGVSTVTGASEGGGDSTMDQLHSDLSEVISHHQGYASDASLYSFLTDFSKLLENLK